MWLEVERAESVQVRVHPRRGLAQLNPRVDEVADFDMARTGSATPLADDSGWIAPVACGLGAELDPTLGSANDRVVGQRIQKFESAVYGVPYRTRLGGGTVRVSGQGVVLPDSEWAPLRRRAWVSAAAGGVALVAGLAVVGQYVGQHPWFEAHGNAGPMRALVLVAAVLVALCVARALLAGASRNRVWLGALAAPVGLAWLGIAGLWTADGPSMDAVARAMEAGDLEDAQAELDAVRALLGKVDGYAAGEQQLADAQAEREAQRKRQEDADHLARVTDATTLTRGVSEAKGTWHHEAVALRAVEVLRRKGARELERAVQVGDVDALKNLVALLKPVDKTLAATATAEHKLAAASACVATQDFACASEELDAWTEADTAAVPEGRYADVHESMVRSLEQTIRDAPLDADDLTKRVAALDTVLAQARLYERLTDQRSPRKIGGLERAKTKAQRKLAAQERAAAQRVARAAKTEARRQAAAERKARRAKKAKRSSTRRSSGWGGGRVQCCDGTLSPSCRYGGSLRGCCSHHGGVC